MASDIAWAEADEEDTGLETVIRHLPLAQRRVFGCDDFFERPSAKLRHAGARFQTFRQRSEIAPSHLRRSWARFLRDGLLAAKNCPALCELLHSGNAKPASTLHRRAT
jgi:hypothetical protein